VLTSIVEPSNHQSLLAAWDLATLSANVATSLPTGTYGTFPGRDRDGHGPQHAADELEGIDEQDIISGLHIRAELVNMDVDSAIRSLHRHAHQLQILSASHNVVG